MSVVEFVGRKVQGPEDIPAAIGEVQEHLRVAGRDTSEAISKVTAEVAGLVAKSEDAARAKKLAEDALEIAKAAQEASRQGGAESRDLEAGVRSLARTFTRDHFDVDPGMHDAGKFATVSAMLLTPDADLRSQLGDGAAYRAVKRLRVANDCCTLFDQMYRGLKSTSEVAAYDRVGGIKSTKVYKELYEPAARALDAATSGASSEWVPSVVFSRDLFTDVQLAKGAIGLFDWMDMPQQNWTLPGMYWDVTANLVAEQTANPSGTPKITAQDKPSSFNLTLTAVKFATATYWSRELDQDSIVSILPNLVRGHSEGHLRGLENAVVNGQNAGGIDNGYSAGAGDVREAFDGLRKLAKIGTLQVDLGGVISAEALAQMIGKAGAYADPASCAFVTSYAGFARLLVATDKASGGSPIFMRSDAAGAGAGFNPAIGRIMGGYPVVLSGAFPAVDTTGVVSATGANNVKTQVLFVNRKIVATGKRQGLEFETSKDYAFLDDLIAVKATARWAFKRMIAPSTTKTWIVEGVNLPNF